MKFSLSGIHISKARIVNWIILFVIIYNMFNIHYWTKENRVIWQDVISYYSYLPATFIYKDISLEFINDGTGFYSDKFWPLKTPEGKYVIKTTMGMSFLYAPFFFLGHVAANVLGYPATGFSMPYIFLLVMSSIFYFSLGLYFLRKVLENYFSQKVVIFTLITIVFGTNLYLYAAIEAAMPHAYLFSLFAAFIYLTIKWYKNPKVKSAILIGLVAGLITLIRPSNVIILVFFFLWDVKSFSDLQKRLLLFLKNPKFIAALVLCFFIILIPQLAYWKFATGRWCYYSYSDEGFFFLNPQIINGLFSYRKGWFVYTPVMLFAFTGLALSFKKFRTFFFPTLIFIILNIYIITSWWCWWYGGSYGNRAFIDSYAILAISYAVFIDWILIQKKIFKITVQTVIILLILLNLFQTWQAYGNDIHYDSMTKKAYWKVFLRLEKPDRFEKLLQSPDYEKAKNGKKEY
ncbi:MAG: hypothetical protein H8D45_16535 [Bacteroidetes bacterium]|nr:hypothetical protein [Bacteroidota bacterium]MBL7105287.1 hypothetical protein [Bacteroidales bacterium]